MTRSGTPAGPCFAVKSKRQENKNKENNNKSKIKKRTDKKHKDKHKLIHNGIKLNANTSSCVDMDGWMAG